MEKILLKILAEFPASQYSLQYEEPESWTVPILLKPDRIKNLLDLSVTRVKINTNEGTEIEFKTWNK